MNKILFATTLIAAIIIGDVAYAQHRHYAPAPHYAPHRHSVAPYVLGGAALGILGGAIIANEYYRPVCHRVLVEQRWDGFRWVPYYDTVCD